MNQRRGFTLTELLVVMAAGSSAMLTGVAMLHQSLRLASATRQRAAEHQTLFRLADQFRRDVHFAAELVVESPESVRISMHGGDVVRYRAEPGGCERVVLASPQQNAAGEPDDANDTTDAAAKSRQRENYRLLPGGVVRFATLELPRRAALELIRGEPAGDFGQKGHGTERPLTMRVEAVVGRVERLFSTALAEGT